ncbi:MAG: AmmeMemoRadiSam system radical SAM enzyme [Chlorobaculum sp.]|nr:AmmeMemoRadiSam system radical SAM enzyme [Chlorobaculum sp.]
MREANFYHAAPDGVLQCDLCRHYCRIRPGSSGICRARRNVGGKLFTLAYGKAVAQTADPVEKKPLCHFMPGSITWSLGAPGCNFRCANCQNWQISQMIPDDSIPLNKPEEIVQNAQLAGCQSITCTYTEPTIFAEYALETMMLSRQAGLKNIWVSNGYLSKICLDAIRPWLDAINVDLKSMDDAFYRRMCGARLDPVLDSLRQIHRSGIHLEITTLVIPGHADDPAMLQRLASFIVRDLGAETPWHLTPFWPEISWKMQETPPTSPEMIEKAWEIGRKAGLSYIYAGKAHSDTLCPRCGARLVARNTTPFSDNQIERFDADGRCPACHAPSPIHH